jgi:hypothetical protein
MNIVFQIISAALYVYALYQDGCEARPYFISAYLVLMVGFVIKTNFKNEKI